MFCRPALTKDALSVLSLYQTKLIWNVVMINGTLR